MGRVPWLPRWGGSVDRGELMLLKGAFLGTSLPISNSYSSRGAELSLAIPVLGSLFWWLLFPFWPLYSKVVVKKGCSRISGVTVCNEFCFEEKGL